MLVKRNDTECWPSVYITILSILHGALYKTNIVSETKLLTSFPADCAH